MNATVSGRLDTAQEWPSLTLERLFGVTLVFALLQLCCQFFNLLLHFLLRRVASLFRSFAVEVLDIGLRFFAGMVDDSIPMIGRSIERIELQWNTAGIDNVVIRSGRDD